MKKFRLLEIIREEIAGALTEAGLGDQIAALDKQIEQVTKQMAPLQKKKADLEGKKAILSKKEADLSAKTQSQLEEATLNETPVYDVNDMEGFKSTLDKFREEGVSKSKSLNLLLKKLEDEGTVDTNALSKQFGVDTATFNNKEIRKFLNRPEDEFFQDKSGEELIDFTPYLDKSDKPRGRAAGEKSEPKEKTALPDSGVKKKEKEEPKKEKESKKEEPKKATLTKGDDGFDDVSYSKSEKKKEEPKKEKEGPKTVSSKLDKISDDKDNLIKLQRQAEVKMKELADKRKNAKESEKDALMDELKKVNKVKAEIDKKLDKLGF
jgi:hypothetical protein